MDIVKIVVLGLISVILTTVLKQQKQELSLQLSIVAGLIIFLMVIDKIPPILKVLENLADKAGIELIYFSILLKIIGISYITEFGAQVCRDAGEVSIATKIELGGKILIFLQAIPIVLALLELLLSIMQ